MTDIKIVRSTVSMIPMKDFTVLADIPRYLHGELVYIFGDHALDIHDDAIAFNHKKAKEVQAFLMQRGVVVNVQREESLAAGDGLPGVMIALWVDKEVGAKLAVPEGEQIAEMHLTLVYLGKITKIDSKALAAVKAGVQRLAQVYQPLKGTISGVGRFSNGEGMDVLHACPDVPGLSALREAIFQLCVKSGVEPASNHGFDPHITLKYLDEGEPSPLERLDPMPIEFDRVWFCVGEARESFPLGSPVATPTSENPFLHEDDDSDV